MKTYKPYLSLTKGSSGDYTLDAVFLSPKSQNIISIEQKELTQSGKTYWGVVISVSSDIQIICGPESNVLFTTVPVAGHIASTYKTTKCRVQVIQSLTGTSLGDAEADDTDVDFDDGKG